MATAVQLDLIAIEDKIAELRQLVGTAWLAVGGIASGVESKDGNNGLQFLLANVQDELRELGNGIAKSRGGTHSVGDLRISLRRDARRRRKKAA